MKKLLMFAIVFCMFQVKPIAHSAEPKKSLDPIAEAFSNAVEIERDRFRPEKMPLVKILDPEDPSLLPEVPTRLRLEEEWQTGKKCGPVALYFLLNLKGISVNLDDVLKLIDTDEGGCSLQTLAEVSTQLGLAGVSVRKVSPADLQLLSPPFIIHWESVDRDSTKSGHFDVVVKVSRDGDLDTLDTTNCKFNRLSLRAVSQQMSGYVLVAGNRHILLDGWSLMYMLVIADAVMLALIRYRNV